MELLMAMSLVHSTDVRTVKLMAMLMETKWEQLMVSRLVQPTERLMETSLVCLSAEQKALQLAQMTDMN
eukprot:scaffold21556_cov44-Skeletonema_dohrnii-CCMP3373.AAC.1